MDDQTDQKIFSLPESLLMVFVALINDGLLILSEILAIFTVGGSLLVIEIINIALWAILLFWFVIRTRSFGTIGWIQTIGGILESIGIPGKTVTTIACIYIANRPKLTAAAQLASASGKFSSASGKTVITGATNSEGKFEEWSRTNTGGKATEMNVRSEEMAKKWGDKINNETGGRLINKDDSKGGESDYSQEGFINKNIDNVQGSGFNEMINHGSGTGADIEGNDVDLRKAA